MTESAEKPSGPPKWLRHPMVRLIVGIVVFLVVTSLLGFAAAPFATLEGDVALLILAIVFGTIYLLIYVGIVRLLERRPADELAPRPALIEFPLGLLAGVLLFGITVGIMALLGYYHVDSVNPWTVVLPGLAGFIAVGVVEELIFRGFLFRLVEEWLGTWWALIISALIFGLLHMVNPNSSLWAGIAIALEAGVLLAATYVLTGRLWVAIGLHIAWNFMQGPIFGIAVSGNAVGDSLIESTVSGPLLLTGGAFGAEASIFAVILTLIAGALLLYRAYTAGRFHPRRTKDSASPAT